MTALADDIRTQNLLRELEPVVETELNRHLSMAKEWFPHEYVPWGEGVNFSGVLEGREWTPEEQRFSEAARTSLVINLLTEDNLPSYHREIATYLGRDGVWGEWIGRWTAEEGRHGIAIRDYLTVTRSVDPVALERARMSHMTEGFEAIHPGAISGLAYVSFQELATRVSHRNTGKACNEPIAEQLLARISNDENLHMIFYRDVSAAGLDLAPNMAMASLYRILKNFKMPGYTVPEFRRKAVIIATGGVYDPRIHLEDVVMPVLKKWRIFEREDFTGEGARMRDELAVLIEDLEQTCVKFEDAKARKLERDAKLAEKRAAKSVLAAAAS